MKTGNAHFVAGVLGRLTEQEPAPGGLWRRQLWVSDPRPAPGYAPGAAMTVCIRFDDECRNGHNSFSITGDIREPVRGTVSCGCLHEKAAEIFPELAPLIRWHLVDSTGPMHYLANTLYFVREKQLDLARAVACWPEATDTQLNAPQKELAAALNARLPGLLAEFRAAVESTGLKWGVP